MCDPARLGYASASMKLQAADLVRLLGTRSRILSRTPIHIQPEWYFLFAYAILRSIPNKLGGVIALVASVAIYYRMPFINSSYAMQCCFSKNGPVTDCSIRGSPVGNIESTITEKK